jgi:polyhydroxyalkanoate synthesis regulator phasin
MFRVSGPNYVSIYNVNGCIVSLFGDIHFNKNGSCKECETSKDCMNIIQLYDNLKQPVDIFLEAPHLEKNSPKYKNLLKYYYSKFKNNNGWLTETNNHFKSLMYEKTHKFNNKVHIHYGDLRHHTSLEYLYMIKHVLSSNNLSELDNSEIEVAQALLEDLQTKHHFKKLVDAMVKSNDFTKDIETTFGETAWIYADEQHLTTFNGVNAKIHRLRKQILKLSPKLQKAVLNYHKEKCNDILQDYNCFHYVLNRKRMIKMLDSKVINAKTEAPLVINTCIDQWLSHVMEMYIIARMLYNIEKGESKNITVYTGANHIYAINYFLKNYIAAQHTWKYDSEKEKSKEVRCVLIPQDIIQQLTS